MRLLRRDPATPRRAPRTAAAVGVVAAVATALLVGPPTPSGAATRTAPGNFTGYAFDTCDAPSQRAMEAWRRHSRYGAIGIYVAGASRACAAQPHLTRSWVRTQERRGWRLLPLVVGRQASCTGYAHRISPDPARRYARATRQGARAADAGVRASRRLGIGRGSVLWFDLEHFDTDRTRCRRSALAFVSGWTTRLRHHGYRSGLYSSASSGIAVLDGARRRGTRHALPGYLWIAEWNGRSTVRSAYLSEDGWWPHRRVHQFRGGHAERHGGVRLVVDSNYLSTGRGTLAGRPARPCGVRVGFESYPTLHSGDRGPRVRAAQCLLRRERVDGRRRAYDGRVTGSYSRATRAAVRRFERDRGLRVDGGALGARTWTALLSAGSRPLLKHGSGGRAVRRLQRALDAATGAELPLDGVFSAADRRAVRRVQRHSGLPVTGVATARVWRVLQRGSALPRDARRPVSGAPLRHVAAASTLPGTEHSLGALRR